MIFEKRYTICDKDDTAMVYLNNKPHVVPNDIVNYIEKLQKENENYIYALKTIERECSRDDTTAWRIASDVLEEFDE